MLGGGTAFRVGREASPPDWPWDTARTACRPRTRRPRVLTTGPGLVATARLHQSRVTVAALAYPGDRLWADPVGLLRALCRVDHGRG